MRLLIVLLAAVVTLSAQTTPYAPKQTDRPDGITGDEPGFQPIFDGKTIDRLGRQSAYWRAEDGIARWRDHCRTRDQEQYVRRSGGRAAERLRAEARLPDHSRRQQRHQLPERGRSRSGHSREHVRDEGLSVRSRRQKALPGNNYEEKGRLFLAVRGQMTHVVGDRPPIVI